MRTAVISRQYSIENYANDKPNVPIQLPTLWKHRTAPVRELDIITDIILYIHPVAVNRETCYRTLRALHVKCGGFTTAELFNRDSPKRRRAKRTRGRDSLTEVRLRRVAQTGINLNNYAALCGRQGQYQSTHPSALLIHKLALSFGWSAKVHGPQSVLRWSIPHTLVVT